MFDPRKPYHYLHNEDRTIYYDSDSSETVYPCRCGVAHQGPYAAEIFAQHECFHRALLVRLTEDTVCCPLCGAVFGLDTPGPELDEQGEQPCR